MVVYRSVETVYTDSTRISTQMMEYSLNLWESNLTLFEAVSAEEEEAAIKLS
jgi:hypothetical protein